MANQKSCCRQLIEYLVNKWVYDHSTLLMDESQEEYSAYYIRSDPDHKYGFGGGFRGGYPNSIHDQQHHPEPVHIPKPQYPASTYHRPGPGNTYIPPSFRPRANATGGFRGYPERRQPLASGTQYKFAAELPERQGNLHGGGVQGNAGDQYPYLQQNDLWNR